SDDTSVAAREVLPLPGAPAITTLPSACRTFGGPSGAGCPSSPGPDRSRSSADWRCRNGRSATPAAAISVPGGGLPAVRSSTVGAPDSGGSQRGRGQL